MLKAPHSQLITICPPRAAAGVPASLGILAVKTCKLWRIRIAQMMQYRYLPCKLHWFPSQKLHQQYSLLRCRNETRGFRQSIYRAGDQYNIIGIFEVGLASLTSATHFTRISFLSKASCRSLTTSWPMAFLAEKPLVHVRIFPDPSAVCSTGKEKVSPRGMSADGESSSCGDKSSEVAVKNASTDSAR